MYGDDPAVFFVSKADLCHLFYKIGMFNRSQRSAVTSYRRCHHGDASSASL